jgi:hypothetical protein
MVKLWRVMLKFRGVREREREREGLEGGREWSSTRSSQQEPQLQVEVH